MKSFLGSQLKFVNAFQWSSPNYISCKCIPNHLDFLMYILDTNFTYLTVNHCVIILTEWKTSTWQHEHLLGYNETFNKIGNTAKWVNFLDFQNAASFSIELVIYDSVPSEFLLLLIYRGCSSSTFFFSVYNEDRQFWDLKIFYLPVPCRSVMRMTRINAASSRLLWDDVSVYYTYEKNTANGYCQVFGSKSSLSRILHGITIHQIILS